VTVVADAPVQVYLSSNVSVGGKDYGPDFGTRVADLPGRFAKQLLRDGRARPAFLGPCTRETARCDTATDQKTATARCCIGGALASLEVIGRLCDQYGVPWFADYGSLLSVGCAGTWFWNDKDCDIGVPAEHQATFLRMKSLFEAEGFTFAYSKLADHEFGGGDRVKIRWSSRNTVNTDVFFWHRHDEKGRCTAGSPCYSSGKRFVGEPTLHRRAYIKVDQFKGREFPAAWAAGYARAPLEHLQASVLLGWERLGAHRYGERWGRMRALIASGTDPVTAAQKSFPAALHDGVAR
jgi:hypothetical protein